MFLQVGVGPFRAVARALATLCILEAVVLWLSADESAVLWFESDRNTLLYKEAFDEVHLYRRHFGLSLAASGGFSLLHTLGAGGYTLNALLKKRV